jgi:CheY-like chemotaxis protein
MKQRLSRRPCALVIDDYPDTRDLYVTAFSSGGFDVAVAGAPAEAAARLALRRPDVVLADVKSPAGLAEVLETLALSDPAGRAPLIVVGADVHGHGVGHTLTSAVVALSKPCLPDALVWQARQLVGAAATAIEPGSLPSAEAITMWRIGPLECIYRARTVPEGCSHLEIRRGAAVIWLEQTATADDAADRSLQLRRLAERSLL